MADPLRIVIAEDHQTVREGIKLLIGSQPDMEVIGEAGDGETALQLADELTPDLMILDVSMPVMNGLKATEKLRGKYPKLRILALTRHKDDGYLRQLISAGSNGYVLKQSAPNQLLNAIRAVGSGSSFLDPTLTQRVMRGYAGEPETLRGEPKSELSSREEEVIRLVAIGYSNKEIAADLDLSVKTIEAHKANAMQKLGFSSRVDLVKYAVFRGWLEDD
ncbi:MAG TPA: response regulator transcription factor [Pyrinomonadaceae bacterium]